MSTRYKTTVLGKLLALMLMLFSIGIYAGENSKLDQEIAAKFAAADKNHDGKLTLAEAQAGMPRIAANFSYIDTQNKGYVTLAEIEAVANSR
jgi:Ca2+-binding EF-hand superfamily protein